MRKLAIGLLLLFMATAASAADLFPKIPKKMLAATHRLGISYNTKDGTVFEHGSAVAIDLSKKGIASKRFLLTAAHCVENSNKDNTLVEIIVPGKSPVWTRATVVAKNPEIDIAIIETDSDMPELIEVDESDDTEIGDPLIAIGSPKGQALAATIGYLSGRGQKENDKAARNFWQASMPIYHGNSGGGIFDANRSVLVGIVTAIEGEPNGVSAPNIADFVGTEQMRKFVADNLNKMRPKEK